MYFSKYDQLNDDIANNGDIKRRHQDPSYLLECIINTRENIKVKVQTYSFRGGSIASYLVLINTKWQKRLVFYCALNPRFRSMMQINLRAY